AMVGDTEYLFADLDVPAGTHALPVTLPRSVKELIVATYYGVHTVAPNALVDIDAAPADGRAANNVFVTATGVNDEMTFEWTEDGQPYLAFKPGEFLTEYMAANPEGQDNVDYEINKKNQNTPYGIQSILNPDKATHETLFWTAARSDGQPNTFYVFPIYWRKNKDGNKDYRTMLHRAGEGYYYINGQTDVEFGEAGETSANNPFPHLGYSTTVTERTEIDFDNLSDQFTFDDGSFDKAYDPAQASMVISRGIKIKFKNSGSYKPSLALAVASGYGADGTAQSFVSSSPFFNTTFWGGKYFDVSIHNLYLAQAATKCTTLNKKDVFITGNLDELVQAYKDAMPEWAQNNPAYIESSVKSYIAKFKQEGDFLNRNDVTLNKILAFNSPASSEADKSPRDFGDVLFLICPHAENTTIYKTSYTIMPTPFQWTIAAEDLGGSFDWDFNDVVFTFTDVIRNLKSSNHFSSVAMLDGPAWAQAVRVISVTPKAAGGTMPIYITYTGTSVKTMPYLPSDGDDMFSEVNAALKNYLDEKGEEGTFVIGCELHKWLGASTHTKQINVGEKRTSVSPETVEFVIPTNLD
ncbi:MAG: hypothetical protein K2L99_02000, partial [Muribaculaceae bacterium]|nr:hypothetical protein [Muribaculaceae bacterium]